MPNEIPTRYAVLGSGPLPLTSICLLQALKKRGKESASVHNIDRDSTAISQSTKLCKSLGNADNIMSFQRADAAIDELDLSPFDVVYLAALVCTSCEDKLEIVENVTRMMRPGAYLILRTAHSLRSLLYPVATHCPPTSVVRIL